MDIISSYDLRKYSQILDEINSEFEKSKQLKDEIHKVENKITFLRLRALPCQKKISHVNVKIFSKISDIINLYDVDISYSLQKFTEYEGYKFFLVEVILTKSLLDKLTDCNWRLQISIDGSNSCTSKIVCLSDRNSVMEIIPVKIDTYEGHVETTLFYCYENDWINLDLCSVEIDISYFFETFKEESRQKSLEEDLLNITQLYNKDINLNCVKSLNLILAQVKCGLSKDFVPIFIKNSYHQLDLEIFSDFANDNKRSVAVYISINNQKVVVLYHKDTNVLKIKSSPDIILQLKRFFSRYLLLDEQQYTKKVKRLVDNFNLEETNCNELLDLYQEIRKLKI